MCKYCGWESERWGYVITSAGRTHDIDRTDICPRCNRITKDEVLEDEHRESDKPMQKDLEEE